MPLATNGTQENFLSEVSGNGPEQLTIPQFIELTNLVAEALKTV